MGLLSDALDHGSDATYPLNFIVQCGQHFQRTVRALGHIVHILNDVVQFGVVMVAGLPGTLCQRCDLTSASADLHNRCINSGHA